MQLIKGYVLLSCYHVAAKVFWVVARLLLCSCYEVLCSYVTMWLLRGVLGGCQDVAMQLL